MPTSRTDLSQATNTRRQVARRGQWPSEVSDLGAVEYAILRDDGRVDRGAWISWRHDQSADSTSRYLIFLREDEDPTWHEVGRSRDRSFELAGLQKGLTYVVCVIPLGLQCCAHRPPEASSAWTTITVRGVEPMPDAVTSLTVAQHDDRLEVDWTPPTYPAPLRYEVRIGSSSIGGTVAVADTATPRAVLAGVAATGETPSAAGLVVFVVPVTSTGLRGPSASASVTPMAPADAEVVSATDHGSWSTGTHSNTEAVGGELRLQSGETSGTYTSAVIDAGELVEMDVRGFAHAAIENVGLTWSLAWLTWGATPAQRRTWDGGIVDEWMPRSGLTRRSSPAWGELTEETWGGTGLRWDSFTSARSTEDPADLTWEEAEFAWDSAAAESWTWDGPVSSAGTTYDVEARFSDDNATWSAWSKLVAHTRTTRYVQWRIAITQPAAALRVSIEIMSLVLTRRFRTGYRTQSEEPSGAINGSNDEFTITSTPTGPLRLHLDGVLQRDGTDYSLSGTTITMTSAPTGGQWLQAVYPY